jgi:hypothetical protein
MIADEAKLVSVLYNYLNLPGHIHKNGPAPEEAGDMNFTSKLKTFLFFQTRFLKYYRNLTSRHALNQFRFAETG